MMKEKTVLEIRTYKNHDPLMLVSSRNSQHGKIFKYGHHSGDKRKMFEDASLILMSRPASVVTGRMAREFRAFYRDVAMLDTVPLPPDVEQFIPDSAEV